jgi:outer membrane protein assembly factor BamD (BamD/ComL family)
MLIAAAALAAALVFGCATAPKEIPTGLSVSELVQKAQDATDVYNYAAAIAYYQAALDRYGSDPAVTCMADYEIAFIYYKQEKYAESEKLFKTLLALYEGPAGATLPVRYKILADKVLPKVQNALGENKPQVASQAAATGSP